MDFSDRQYDVVLMINVLHHLSAEESRTLLGFLAHVTGSYLITSDPVQQSPKNYIGRFLTSHDRGKFIRPTESHLDLISEFFDIVQTRDTKVFFTETSLVLARPK